MKDKIIAQATSFQGYIADLKSRSKYYPSILTELKSNVVDRLPSMYASALVRIERNGIWYTVHVVESIIPTANIGDPTEWLLKKFSNSVYMAQLFHVQTQFDSIDKLQISEMDRMNPTISIIELNEKTK